LLDLYVKHKARIPQRNQYLPGWDLISAAATVARTPAAPLSCDCPRVTPHHLAVKHCTNLAGELVRPACV